MDLAARRIPAPSQNLESAPFWEAAKEGRFLVKHCKDCGCAHWYPRAFCPFCSFGETEWRESAGTGEIYSYSIQRRGTPVPYAIAYVTLDEGTTLITNIVDCDLDRLSIGQRVKIRWTPTAEGEPPAFAFTPV